MPSARNNTAKSNQELLMPTSLSTYSPISYIGGKDKLWSVAKKLLPDVSEIASPFLGGAGLELHIAANGTKVYGSDIFWPLVNFWKHYLNDPKKLAHTVHKIYPLSWDDLRALYPPLGEKNWDNAGWTHLKSDYQKAAYFWIMNKMTWSGKTMISFGMPQNPVEKEYFEYQWDAWHNPNLQVEQRHWRETFEAFPDLFLYLDPPYFKKEEYYGQQYTDRTFDHVGLRDALRARKTGWMLSYGDHPSVHELYAEFMIMRPPTWFYSTSMKRSSELLILNDIGYDEKTVRMLIESTNRHTDKMDNVASDTSEQLQLHFA